MVIDVIKGENRHNWNNTVGINKYPIQFKIDTSAQCNVMSLQTYHQLNQRPLEKSRARLVAFEGNRLRAIEKTSRFWFANMKESTGQLNLRLPTMSPT